MKGNVYFVIILLALMLFLKLRSCNYELEKVYKPLTPIFQPQNEGQPEGEALSQKREGKGYGNSPARFASCDVLTIYNMATSDCIRFISNGEDYD